MMDSGPNENMVLARACDSLSPSTPLSSSVNGVQSSMAPPNASTLLAGQVPPQLGQCVYVLSPWRRNRTTTVFTASQSTSQNNPGLLRFPHTNPAPVGLLHLAPVRPYYPPVPSQTSSAGVPPDFPHDYRYDYYNSYSGPDFEPYTAGQDIQSAGETTQPNYESVYSPAYPHQHSIYPYGQQQCWDTAVSYGAGECSDKTLVYYPDQVGDRSNGPVTSDGGNVTKKSVRVKFMGPQAMYLTTKTLEMQPGDSSVDVRPGMSVDASPQVNIPVYENLVSGADDGLGLNDVQVVQTLGNGDATQGYDDDQERVTFNSIEEALASIDPISLPEEAPLQPAPTLADKTFLQVSTVAYQGLRMADEKQEEVIKAAKSLFSKRTRTLYHWLYPETSKNKLKATVSAAWDTLHEDQKQFYVSQVLGRFGLQASSLMINPQLDGMKVLSTDALCQSTADRPRLIPPPLQEPGKLSSAIEAQQAVNQLFASCADSESWTSYCGTSPANATPSTTRQAPTLAPTALIRAPVASVPTPHSSRSTKSRGVCGSSHGQTDNRRKRSYSRLAETGGRARLGAINDHLDEEVTILKRMRESKLEAAFDGDSELTNELEKFRVMAQDSDRNANGDDFWRRTPDPDDLFTHFEF